MWTRRAVNLQDVPPLNDLHMSVSRLDVHRTAEREQIAGGSDEENAWRQFIAVESIYHVELARQAKCL